MIIFYTLSWFILPGRGRHAVIYSSKRLLKSTISSDPQNNIAVIGKAGVTVITFITKETEAYLKVKRVGKQQNLDMNPGGPRML